MKPSPAKGQRWTWCGDEYELTLETSEGWVGRLICGPNDTAVGNGLFRPCMFADADMVYLRGDEGGAIVRPSPEGQALVDLLVEVLSVRAGETLTPEVIVERARNAAQSLMGEYEMTKRSV